MEYFLGKNVFETSTGRAWSIVGESFRVPDGPGYVVVRHITLSRPLSDGHMTQRTIRDLPALQIEIPGYSFKAPAFELVESTEKYAGTGNLLFGRPSPGLVIRPGVVRWASGIHEQVDPSSLRPAGPVEWAFVDGVQFRVRLADDGHPYILNGAGDRRTVSPGEVFLPCPLAGTTVRLRSGEKATLTRAPIMHREAEVLLRSGDLRRVKVDNLALATTLRQCAEELDALRAEVRR